MGVGLRLTLEEVAAGAKKEIVYDRLAPCPDCDGSGLGPDGREVTCPDCHGQGRVVTVQRTFLGDMQTATTCKACGGTGRTIENPCPACTGPVRATSSSRCASSRTSSSSATATTCTRARTCPSCRRRSAPRSRSTASSRARRCRCAFPKAARTSRWCASGTSACRSSAARASRAAGPGDGRGRGRRAHAPAEAARRVQLAALIRERRGEPTLRGAKAPRLAAPSPPRVRKRAALLNLGGACPLGHLIWEWASPRARSSRESGTPPRPSPAC